MSAATHDDAVDDVDDVDGPLALALDVGRRDGVPIKGGPSGGSNKARGIEGGTKTVTSSSSSLLLLMMLLLLVVSGTQGKRAQVSKVRIIGDLSPFPPRSELRGPKPP